MFVKREPDWVHSTRTLFIDCKIGEHEKSCQCKLGFPWCEQYPQFVNPELINTSYPEKWVTLIAIFCQKHFYSLHSFLFVYCVPTMALRGGSHELYNLDSSYHRSASLQKWKQLAS